MKIPVFDCTWYFRLSGDEPAVIPKISMNNKRFERIPIRFILMASLAGAGRRPTLPLVAGYFYFFSIVTPPA